MKHIVTMRHLAAMRLIWTTVSIIVGMQMSAQNSTAERVVPLSQREVRTEQGITQQPNDKMAWLLEARFGMFIHWGLYAGTGQGEWYMENKGVLPEEYRKLAYPQSGEQYFAADKYNPDEWATLAKDAGMRMMCLTTMHHDGYALFNSRAYDAFTSMQTHNHDFVSEYVKACRAANLRVGLYKTLINWRYPGYYDVNGTDCKPNKFGYTTARWHKDNARLMKEQLYVDTYTLMSQYGKIDLLFWDGGWLAQQGKDADGAYFWEPYKYLDTNNAWGISPYMQDFDEETGKPLGLMGIVRKYQPNILTNIRSGWLGDFDDEEGSHTITGRVRSSIREKCMTMASGWGYTAAHADPERVITAAKVKRMLADCVIRNMTLLLNVAPDRHGQITQTEQDVLHEVGQWTRTIAPAIYGTEGGPWQPIDGQFGYAYKGNTIYLFLLDGFKGTTFTLPPLLKGQKIRRINMLNKNNERILFDTHRSRETTLTLPFNLPDGIHIIAIDLNTPVYP